MKVVNNFFDKKPKIHFIGVGGIGMSALAGVCLSYGYTVTGSDVCDNENIQSLTKLGAKITLFHSKENIGDCDIVVFSTAIKPDNCEILQAVKLNKCVLERHKFLSVIFNCFEKSIAVSGSHGKTTVCGMLSQILIEGKKDPLILIGGNLTALKGNFRKGNGVTLVEACEYKRNFLSLKPFVPVILNIENDHMDYFKDSDDVVDAFISFSKNMKEGGTLVLNGDDEICDKLKKDVNYITFGFKDTNDCYAKDLRKYRGKYSFTLVYKQKNLRVKLSVYGLHNIYNALAAYCAAVLVDVDDESYLKAMEKYKGIDRRFEYTGRLDGASIIIDYAHHPREIEAVLKTARDVFKGKITAVFQPHTYSRTKSLMNDFVKSFDYCDRLLLLPVYPAREVYDKDGSSAVLYENLIKHKENVIYLDSFSQAENYLRQNKSACIIILGAGDIYKLSDMIKE